MKNVEIQSILREVVKEVELEPILEIAKLVAVRPVYNSHIKEEDKFKIIKGVKESRTHLELVKYLYNSILAYEGCRVVNKSLNGGRIK